MPRCRLLAAIAITAWTLIGCSNDDAILEPEKPNQNVKIEIAPKRTTIMTADTLILTATVTGTTNTGVQWSAFSTTTNYGFISSNGVYKAPATIVGDSLVVIVEAAASANREKTDSAIIVVKPRERIIPNAGSSYSYSQYSTDSAGMKIPGSDNGSTMVVSNRWISHAGLDSVVSLTEGSTPTRVRYEANGDLLYAYPSNVPGSSATAWIRYPFGSRQEQTITTDDTSYADGARYTRSVTTSYELSEMMSVGSQQLAVHRVHAQIIEERTGVDGYRLVTDRNYWFAPAIGWFVKEEERRMLTGPTGVSHEGRVKTMTGYSVK